MDCKTAKEYIDMYVDDMLDDAEKQQLMFHIQSCDQCKKEYENAMRLKAALVDLDELEPPKGLAQSAIKKAKRRKVPSIAYITTAVAAAIVLVVVLSSGLFPGQKMHMLQRAEDAPAEDMAYDESATEMTKSMEAKEDLYAGDADMAPAAMPEMEVPAEPEAEEPETIQESVANGQKSDAGSRAGHVLIPIDSEEAWKRLEAFIEENDIEAEYYQEDSLRVISFFVEEQIYNEFIELIEELSVDHTDIYPNEWVRISN